MFYNDVYNDSYNLEEILRAKKIQTHSVI